MRKIYLPARDLPSYMGSTLAHRIHFLMAQGATLPRLPTTHMTSAPLQEQGQMQVMVTTGQRFSEHRAERGFTLD